MKLAVVALPFLVTPALASAAADLSVSVTPTALVHVYETGRYDVRVANVGNQTAANAVVEVELPVTSTSPTVHVLGVLGAYSAGCTRSGATLACNLGSVRKGRSVTVFLELLLPLSSAPIALVARARTDSAEPNQGNNVAVHTASLLHHDVPVAAPRRAHVRHCTGQGLTSFYECTLYPSSLSWHDIQMNADGTVTFLAAKDGDVDPSVTGTWSQSSPQSLALRYSDPGGIAAVFDGFGVAAGSCFEGVTTFPGSPYVAPYEVCLQ